MHARAVDDAAARLRALRHEEWEDLGLAAFALGLALVAGQTRSQLAVPLLVGGLAVAVLGVRATCRRWDLIERLAAERDAYVIREVRVYASRQATMERRRGFAAMIRSYLPQERLVGDSRVASVAHELEALASDLDDESLALDLASAVACMRLLSDLAESPLLDRTRPVEDLRSRVRRIRSGFTARPAHGLSPIST
jgi:hypothetical protein